MYKKVRSHSVAETEQFGAEFAACLQKGDFVALCGDLGAGKTAFTRGIASVLVPHAEIQSPTYAMICEYRTPDLVFCHCDMYRVTGEDDLYSIGYYDYEDAVRIVEWPEKIAFALPPQGYCVTIRKCEEDPDLRELTLASYENSKERDAVL